MSGTEQWEGGVTDPQPSKSIYILEICRKSETSNEPCAYPGYTHLSAGERKVLHCWCSLSVPGYHDYYLQQPKPSHETVYLVSNVNGGTTAFERSGKDLKANSYLMKPQPISCAVISTNTDMC